MLTTWLILNVLITSMKTKETLVKELEVLQQEFNRARESLVNSDVYKHYESIGAQVSSLLRQIKESK